MSLRAHLVLFGFAIVCGCGSDVQPFGGDGGAPTDAHTAIDAAMLGPDLATGSIDASDGNFDQGPPPRVDIPNLPCTDTIADVYVTPNNLPPMTDATRGDVVRCAHDFDLPLAMVQTEVAGKGLTTKMTSAAAIYRIAFRTTRGDGSPGVSSARVYLPQTATAPPLSILVAAHPTDGIADSTAPSMDATSNEDLALSWAGLGYPIIVPDYAGLGNEGTQAYLDNHDQAYSILDGARALRKFLPPGAFSQQVAILGYSQGGGAALSAQALAKDYGCDGDLVGVVAFAPEWPTRMNSFGFVNLLQNPNELTIQTGISFNVVEVMRTYAYFYNRVGPAHADDGFPVAKRAGFDNAVNTLSEVLLGGYLQANALHIGDFIDDTLRTTLLDCITNGDQDMGCVDPGKSYYEFLVANFVTSDPKGAPVLFIQGLNDYVMPPASEAACNVQKLTTDGVMPQVCVDPQAQHQDVVGRNMDFVIPWLQARLGGHNLPNCVMNGQLPACTP
jgi:pimeloyl-ACP methyl ester carboxylesterase